MKKATLLYLLTFILFSCGDKKVADPNTIVGLKDTTQIWIDVKVPDDGLNGTAYTIKARRIIDSAEIVTPVDSVVKPDGTISYSQLRKKGIDTAYLIYQQGWGTAIDKPLYPDSFPGSKIITRPVRIFSQFVKEGEIVSIQKWNPFSVPIKQDTTTAKKDTTKPIKK